MKERNCLFIGSPKANPACEIALALLWGARPFEARASDRPRIPIRFVGMVPEHEFKTNALLKEGPWHGFELQCGNSQPELLKVDWLPPERYASFRGRLHDGAALAVCYQ